MIEFIDNGAIVSNEKMAFSYEERGTPREFSEPVLGNSEYFVGDYIVHPYGQTNDLPTIIKNVVEKNYLAPGLLTKKTQLLWGMGPMLYQSKIVDGKTIRERVSDPEIEAWLESFDAAEYLLKCCIDYNHIEGSFTKLYQYKSGRVGKKKIAKLEHIDAEDARLATKKSNRNKRKADTVIVTDFNFSSLDSIINYKAYPIFDFLKPFDSKVSVMYSNLYSFCSDYYNVPDLYGSLEWLRRSTAVPIIFKALSENSLNVKYHVTSPAEYWITKQKELETQCIKIGVAYQPSMLENLKRKILNQIANVLTSDVNAGKFWHTIKSFTVEGVNIIEHGWEIKPIDQNIKDFVEAQIKISQRADYALSGGISLHAALGNVSDTGKSDSGSEQIYALKNYLLTGVNIPEMIVTKPINYAIKANWPEKNIKLGFDHELPEKEQDITASKRLINQAS